MEEILTGTELTCREIIDFLLDYFDGQLPERELVIFQKHLAICTECVEYLESYKATVWLEKQSLHSDLLPRNSPLPDELIRAILSSRQKP